MSADQQPNAVRVEAFDEACLALGQEIVGARMQAKRFDAEVSALRAEIERLTAENEQLREALAADGAVVCHPNNAR